MIDYIMLYIFRIEFNLICVYKNKDINNLFYFQIAHFLEENVIEDYTDNVREIAGYLNTLAKIVRNDNQRNMGLHLFDESLA